MSTVADIPIPSIERHQERPLRPESMSRTSSSSPSNRILTPCSTIESGSNPDEAGSPRAKSTTAEAELTNGIEGVRISSPATAPRGSRSSLTPGSPQRRRRSRSSSALNNSPPHDVRDERQPDNDFERPEVQNALADAKKLMRKITDTLAQSEMSQDETSTLHRLQQEAARLADYRGPVSRTVAFVGESGVGKSSLLNSLLDIEGLARAGNGGSACTCVATEYHHHLAPDFAIQAHLFTTSELREQLSPLLTSYRQFHLHRDDMDAADREHFEAQAKLARDTFQAMFRSRLRGETFLLGGDEDSIIAEMLEWAEELRPSTAAARVEGLSLEQCSAMLSSLSSDPPRRDAPAAWPYIKKIHIFSNAHILSTGLVLADLPGLRDLNSARRLITESYLLQCDEIFAVCRIDRAVTDEGLHDIFELAKNASLSKIGIVCTRSEDIRAKEAIRDPVWKGQRADMIEKFQDAIEIDDAEYADIAEELRALLEVDIEDLLEGERLESLRLSQQKDQVSARRKSHEFQLQQYLMSTRNSIITDDLRRLYGTQPRMAINIPVFCVSNTLYWAVRSLASHKALPTLDLSGILTLRRHCRSIVSSAQLHAAKSYLNDEVPNILSQIDLWVQSGARGASAERRAAMRQTVEEVEKILTSHLRGRRSSIRHVGIDLQQSFRDNIYSRRNTARWSRSASTAASEWSGWHHSTYATFCQNDGDHVTPAVGSRNWNEEATTSLVLDLTEPWTNLIEQFQQKQGAVVLGINAAAEEADDRLETSRVTENSAAIDGLEIALDTHAHILSNSVDRHFEILESKLELQRISLLTSIPSSLVRQAMRSSYRDAKLKYGRGSHRLRINVIEAAFSDPELYNGMLRSAKATFQRDVEATQEAITQSIDEYLVAVGKDLDLVREESVARESEQNPEFSDLVAESVREGWQVMERARAAIPGAP